MKQGINIVCDVATVQAAISLINRMSERLMANSLKKENK